MKTKLSLIVLGLAVAFGLSVAGEADHADYSNCGLCKPMMAEQGLMQNMQWESKQIATGMISVTRVAPEYEAKYARAHKKMMENVAKLEAGESMELCPFCQRMSALAAAGARIENVEVAGTHVMAVTAQSPEVIAKIHEHLKWANQEFGQSHEGHDHQG